MAKLKQSISLYWDSELTELAHTEGCGGSVSSVREGFFLDSRSLNGQGCFPETCPAVHAGEHEQTAGCSQAPQLSLNTIFSSTAGDSPGLDRQQLRSSRIFLMFIRFPYHLSTRVFLSLTSNRRLCYSHRPPWVLQSHHVGLNGMSTQLLCLDQPNPDITRATLPFFILPLPSPLLQQPTALLNFTTVTFEKQKGKVLNSKSIIFAQQHQNYSNRLLHTAPFKPFLQLS